MKKTTKIIVAAMVLLIIAAATTAFTYTRKLDPEKYDVSYIGCVENHSLRSCRQYLSRTGYSDDKLEMDESIDSKWLQEITPLRQDCINILNQEEREKGAAIDAYKYTRWN
jgi:hypothetical protein